jgi:hypothetical protein
LEDSPLSTVFDFFDIFAVLVLAVGLGHLHARSGFKRLVLVAKIAHRNGDWTNRNMWPRSAGIVVRCTVGVGGVSVCWSG